MLRRESRSAHSAAAEASAADHPLCQREPHRLISLFAPTAINMRSSILLASPRVWNQFLVTHDTRDL